MLNLTSNGRNANYKQLVIFHIGEKIKKIILSVLWRIEGNKNSSYSRKSKNGEMFSEKFLVEYSNA